MRPNNFELPNDPEFETLILSAILNSSNHANNYLFSLKDSDFYQPKARLLFNEIKYCYARYNTLDVFILTTYLKENGTLKDCGGLDNILLIANSYRSGVEYDCYVAELKNLAHLRGLIHASKDTISDAVKSQADSNIVMKDLFTKLFSISGIGKEKTHTSKEILEKFSEHGSHEMHVRWMQDRVSKGLTPYTGIACNYPLLDRILGFFRNGCIYYIGARTSMGKTTFMLNLINSMLSNGKQCCVGIFSLEMTAKILTEKMLCLMADIKYSDYEDMKLHPEQVERLFERGEKLKKLPILIEDGEDITISKLRARARRLVMNEGVKIIFIDYLTRIKSDTFYPSKHLQVDEISKGLQSMAKELNIPVVCLAQLNRNVLGRTDPTPSLADFRESGSIEEDCDAALLIHRPDYYNPNNLPGEVQIIVAKNRIRGQLQKIAFAKSPNSELYFETKMAGEVVRTHFQDKKNNQLFEDE